VKRRQHRERSGRRGPYRQASPPRARHRPGARSARRPRCHSTLSQTTCERECPMTTTLPRPRCRLQLEALEDRLLPSVDMVLQWNGVTRDAIRTAGTSAPAASRILAITHAAVYDAVNALDRSHEVYLVDALAHPRASREAAAAAAAHRALVTFYPAQAAALDAQFVASLATIP